MKQFLIEQAKPEDAALLLDYMKAIGGETDMNGYETSYFYPNDGNANTGIDRGEIRITNTQTARFVLPETGGVGSATFIIAGLLLVGMSGVGYLYIERKRRKGGHVH